MARPVAIRQGSCEVNERFYLSSDFHEILLYSKPSMGFISREYQLDSNVNLPLALVGPAG
jgi:hypothetical protein